MYKDDLALGLAMELRRRAEAMEANYIAPGLDGEESPSPKEARKIFHELRVHQIELEMQNEELLRVQEELDMARARYFDLYDLAPVGYFSLSPQGQILEANLTAATLLGSTRGQLVNKLITRFILRDDQDIYYLHRKRCIEGDAPQACELRMVKKNGEILWVRLTGTETRGPSSMPLQEGASVTRLVISDFTEQKEAEDEKARLEAMLQQAKKLETLGVLAGGVAHDFNNLITSIMSNATLGSMKSVPAAATQPFFKAIEKAALKASDLTRQLLAYAGKGKGLVTSVDLDVVVYEIAQILGVSLPSNLTLDCDPAGGLPFVKGDPTQLFQALMNLVMNAFEAFPVDAPGRITVSTAMETIQESTSESGTWVLAINPGRYVTVEVTDTGAGMAPEVLARAFDPFYTTKATGRGLGLAAVQGILGSHGGGIQVRSKPGRGTSVKIYLPSMKDPKPHPVAPFFAPNPARHA